MKIAVLIKQVPVSGQVSVDPRTHALVREGTEGMINPADLNAVEAALRLREETEGSIVVFTMGPPDAEQALREAMARGCDEGCLITDRCLAGGDTVATAKVLAKSIRMYGNFDLILGGAQSLDGATGQVGAMAAEFLSIPHVAEIQEILTDEETGFLKVKKKYRDKLFTARCKLPALFTVNFGCNEPRLATLRSKRAAKGKTMTVFTNAELGFEASETGLAGSPTAVIDSFEPEMKKRAVMLGGTGRELSVKLRELIEKEGE